MKIHIIQMFKLQYIIIQNILEHMCIVLPVIKLFSISWSLSCRCNSSCARYGPRCGRSFRKSWMIPWMNRCAISGVQSIVSPLPLRNKCNKIFHWWIECNKRFHWWIECNKRFHWWIECNKRFHWWITHPSSGSFSELHPDVTSCRHDEMYLCQYSHWSGLSFNNCRYFILTCGQRFNFKFNSADLVGMKSSSVLSLSPRGPSTTLRASTHLSLSSRIIRYSVTLATQICL